MNEVDIANALGQRLAASPSLGTIAWENKDATPSRPYLKFEVVRVDRRGQALSSDIPISRGYLLVTVVGDVDKFSTTATGIADDVVARFAYGARISVTGGEIVVNKPPTILQGFRDGPDWRVPVRIDYEAAA